MLKLDGSAQRGEIYTVFVNAGPVSDPTNLVNIVSAGTQVETRAEAEIEELIEGTSDTYRAMITFTALPVRVGDHVRKGKLIARADFDLHGTPSNVSATIMNGELAGGDNGDRAVFGLHAVVFLNRGDQDGLQIGSLLPVIKNIRLRNPDSDLAYDPKPIGMLKVVAVSGHVSTAVIVAERDAIIPGDETSVATNSPNDAAVEAPPPPPADNPGGGPSDLPDPNAGEPPPP